MALALPIPSDLSEVARIDHLRLRRRLLSGEWSSDLWGRMRQNLGAVRAEAIGEPDMSANPFESVCSGAAALFDLPVRLKHADAASLRAMDELRGQALLDPLMARVQAMTLGCREELVRVDAHVDRGLVTVGYRPVHVDLCAQLRPDPRSPSRPIEVVEWVERHAPDDPTTKIWTREVWSVDGEPVHAVLSEDGKTDLSRFYGLPDGGARGAQYPVWSTETGRPVLPYVLFHASVTGQLLDSYYRQETVQGTLNVGVLWTFFTHVVRRASWPQRWLAGGTVAGASTKGGRSEVVADPATVLEIVKDPQFEGQITAGQWGSGSDPKAVADAISVYEARFAGYAGLDPSDVQRVAGDPRSGIALTVSAAGRRGAQRRYQPVFQPSYEELVFATACAVNSRFGARLLAEQGWTAEFQGLPPSPDERRADREETLALLDRGLLSPTEARARILGETLDQAEAGLRAITAITLTPGRQLAAPRDQETR